MISEKSIVKFEVVVRPDSSRPSVFDENAFINLGNIDEFKAPAGRNIEVARKLQKNKIQVHHIGDFSISASCQKDKFEDFFKTRIREQKPPQGARAPEGYSIFAPTRKDPWELPSEDNLNQLIDRAYLQHPPIYFANERSIPPFWNDKFRLRVPNDIAQIMGANSVHKLGITGKDVKVVMPDTGFYLHPYYKEQGYNFLAVTTPDVLDHTSDGNGHGTGECANLFATAPGINFIGLKMENTTLAFKTAMELRPDIITCSWGYSLDLEESTMPNYLKPLYLEVLNAVKKGVVVCFSAGNGHYGFPGNIPEVISVGGVNLSEDLEYTASDYASGFDSTWFPGRRVPDICGLCGMRPTADYIILPVQQGSELERGNGAGWGAFSGTSAASPMVAGVCALLKEIDPDLTPAEVKNLLKHTARDIVIGTNAHGKDAAPGPDGATGFGLVNAKRAIEALI